MRSRRASPLGPNDALVEVVHPIVRKHPVTGGAALYIDLDRATHVDTCRSTRAAPLLQRLQDHAEAHAPRYAHRWRDHDVLIWTDASVQHKASGDFPVGEARRFYRFLIAGDTPAAFA
jgi:taurine dioxygenase